jgi:hypothetical protein
MNRRTKRFLKAWAAYPIRRLVYRHWAKLLLALGVLAAIVLAMAVRSEAVNEVVYEWNLTDYQAVNPPVSGAAYSLYGNPFTYYYPNNPIQVTQSGIFVPPTHVTGVGPAYQTGTIATASPVWPRTGVSVGNRSGTVEIEMPIGYTLQPGRQYDVLVVFHSYAYRNYASYELPVVGALADGQGFVVMTPDLGIPNYFYRFAGDAADISRDLNERWYGGIISVGPQPVTMSYYSSMTISQVPTSLPSGVSIQFLAGGIPVRIVITDVTPLSADTQAIISVVQDTGQAIIASQDRTTDAINNLADRLDPQDKPALRDIDAQEPEPLPELPTIPSPVDVIGLDGVAAFLAFFEAWTNSRWLEMVRYMMLFSVTLGLVAYLARRKTDKGGK